MIIVNFLLGPTWLPFVTSRIFHGCNLTLSFATSLIALHSYVLTLLFAASLIIYGYVLTVLSATSLIFHSYILTLSECLLSWHHVPNMRFYGHSTLMIIDYSTIMVLRMVWLRVRLNHRLMIEFRLD